MASQVVHSLKQSGDFWVNHANDNLRIPGFRQLDGCNTTVDMDTDPEVFLMLEPVHIRGVYVGPNHDRHCCARRLRTVITTTMLFFRWRLPNGEQMLREHGIDKLPGQIFDEIKTSLAQSDAHFSRFSPGAIKRCLVIFTENVLPQAPSLLATGNGSRMGRDFAREAWVAAKQFKAMLTQGSSTISESSSSMAVEPPDSPKQEVHLSTLTDTIDGPSSQASRMDTQDGNAAVAAPSVAPAASARGGRASSRGGTNPRGGSKASGGRGGKTAAPSRADSNGPPKASSTTTNDNPINDNPTVAVDMFVRRSVAPSPPDDGAAASSSAPPAQPQEPTISPAAPAQPWNLFVPPPGINHPVARKAKPSFLEPLETPMDDDGIRGSSLFDLDEASVHTPGYTPPSNSSPTITPGSAATTALGKHSRAEPDLTEENDSRPSNIQKCQHEPTDRLSTVASEEKARIDMRLAELKEMMDKEAERHRLVATSEELLAMEVNVLRERVRIFEKEKEEALEAQRQHLRPGMVTMKMTPRVQQRANQLFGTSSNDADSGDYVSAARARATRMITHGPAAMDADDESPRSATLRRGLKRLSTSSQLQEPTPVDTPPMGVFRHPVPRGGPESSRSKMTSSKSSSIKASSSKASSSKASRSKASNSRPERSSGRMDLDYDDSDDEPLVAKALRRKKSSSKTSTTARPLRSSGRMDLDGDDSADGSYVPTAPARSKVSSSKTLRSSGRMELDGHDSGEESEVPSESSWTSSIPP